MDVVDHHRQLLSSLDKNLFLNVKPKFGFRFFGEELFLNHFCVDGGSFEHVLLDYFVDVDQLCPELSLLRVILSFQARKGEPRRNSKQIDVAVPEFRELGGDKVGFIKHLLNYLLRVVGAISFVKLVWLFGNAFEDLVCILKKTESIGVDDSVAIHFSFIVCDDFGEKSAIVVEQR